MSEIVPTPEDADPLGLVERTDPSRSPAMVYLASLPSPHSRRTMRACLSTMAHLLMGNADTDPLSIPWERLTYAHTAALRAHLIERQAPATVNKHLAALRGVLTECRRLGLMSADAAASAGDLKPVKGSGPPRGRMLSAGEQAALMRACADGTAMGLRDAALFAVLLGCGLRRAEAVALNVGDLAEGAVLVRHGKGRKARSVPMPAGTRQATAAWLAQRDAPPQDAPLFTSLDRRPAQRGGRISDQSVLHILLRRAALVGVANISPHDFRRTYISQLLDVDTDIVTARQLAGHASVETTARYDRRGEQARQRAAEKIHVPYFPPEHR
ncbi:MAG: tyrosine-type recombinase/integrase [Oscillochloris sp.]|nr:tyrosine-type recombinase/integrase [Oscillochloris sp.]